MFLASPRGLRDPAALAARHELLSTRPEARPIVDWSEDVATRRGVLVPHIDPADGVTGARVLILLEAPGPMTNAGNTRPGSGFISVDNDDKTAENAWVARNQVGLHEDRVLQWNIVPWYLGVASVKPNASELAAGADALAELLQLLPELRVVVASGLYAQRGWHQHLDGRFRHLAVIDTWHPSPLSLNQPGKRAAFIDALGRAEMLSR